MQVINFYLESYRPKPLSFNSLFAIFSSLLFLAGMLLIGWGQANEVSELTSRLEQRKAQLELQQVQLANITKELKINTVVNDLQAQLTAKQQELKGYRKIVSVVNLPLAFTPVKYSQVLHDLSLQTIDFLWLTKIAIQANSLSLNGSTTNTESIPEYIDKLKQANSLKRYFDELKIERKNVNDLINFELVNGKLLNE